MTALMLLSTIALLKVDSYSKVIYQQT